VLYHIVWSKLLKNVFKELGTQWLTSVILADEEAEIRRIVVQSQPSQIVCQTLS
jgi:hypothetical protein